MKCTYCERTEGIEEHHIWPLSSGGPDEAYNIIPVCGYHHGVLHGINRPDNVSELTKRGLERARLKGRVLGNQTNLTEARRLAVASSKARYTTYVERVLPIALAHKARGMTLKEIAEVMNNEGVQTDRGGVWSAPSVCNLLKLAK